MALSYVEIQATGAESEFTVPFLYLEKAHVKVTLAGVPLPFTWTSAQAIDITPKPVGLLRIQRNTPNAEQLVDFIDGSVLDEDLLSLMAKQLFYCLQEALDSAATATGDSAEALQTAAEALQEALDAVTTANGATVTAGNAVTIANQATVTADAADAKGNAAITASGQAVAAAAASNEVAAGAVTTANQAKATAEGVDAKATSALSIAQGIDAKATTALSTAQGIDAKATTALSTANASKAASDTALATANAAKVAADSAKATAEGVDAKATAAVNTANQAQTSVDGAVTTANQAKATAEGVDAKATSALSTAGTANTTANQAKTTAEGFNTRVTANETAIAALGTASKGVLTTSREDATVGRVLKVGDFGLGYVLTKAGIDVDTLTANGDYYVTTPTNVPGNVNGYLRVVNAGPGYASQMFTAVTTGVRQIRTQFNGVWKTWQRLLVEDDLSGLPVASTHPWAVSRATIPAGWIPNDGQVLNRADWPQLWAAVSASAVTDAVWLAAPYDQRGKYSTGNGSTTFRMPDTNGKAADGLTIAAMVLRGDGKLSAGTAGLHQQDQFQRWTFVSPTTPAYKLCQLTNAYANGANSGTPYKGVYMSASPVGDMLAVIPGDDGVGGTPRGGTETRGSNQTVTWCTVGASKAANVGTVDVTALATTVSQQSSDIATKLAASSPLVPKAVGVFAASSTPTILKSVGIASITRSGVGVYTITTTVAIPNAIAQISGNVVQSGNQTHLLIQTSDTTFTTGLYAAGGAFDVSRFSVTIS